MKFEIKKFKKHAGISIEMPAIITGGNAVGKSSIYEAVLFCLNEKDINGGEFTASNVYDYKDAVSERWADVAFYCEGGIFRKKAKPIYERERGSEVEKLRTELSCEYFLNESPVKKSDYDAAIAAMCKNFNFALFTNPMYFFNLPQKEKLKIIARLTDISLVDYLEGLPNKAILKSEIAAQKSNIETLEIKNKSLSETFATRPVGDRNTAKIAALRLEIEALNAEEKSAVPTEILRENEILREKIRDIEGTRFVPTPPVIFQPEQKKELYILRDKFENPKIATMGVEWRALNATLETLKLQIDEHLRKMESLTVEKALGKSKENMCQRCEFCNVECSEIIKNENNAILEAQIKKMIEDTELEFERLKMKENDIKTQISDIIEEGKILRAEDEKKNKVIEIENAELLKQNELIIEANETINVRNAEALEKMNAKNAEIQRENAAAAIIFENEKSKKIEELRAKIVTDFAKIDNTEKINQLASKKYDIQKEDEEKDKELHAWETAHAQIEINNDHADSVREKLIENEKLAIKIEYAERAYRSDCENKIKEFLPEGVEIVLFRKLISADGYEDCAIMKIDGYENPNTSRANTKLAILCETLQNHFAISLPIFFDNAENCEPKNMPKIKNLVEFRVVEDEPLKINGYGI